MVFRYTWSCAVIAILCLLVSCDTSKGNNPLSFVAAEDYNVLITIRPAQIWNSDLMQELLDEVNDTTINKIHAGWDKTFGMRIEESTYLFGGIHVPPSLNSGRVRNALFLGHGPWREEKVREICDAIFDPFEYVEHGQNDGTYYVLSPPKDEDYTFAYAMTDTTAIIGLENSVVDSLDVISGRKKSILLDRKYRENNILVDKSAALTAVVWDVSDLLEVGTTLLRMQQQRGSLPTDIAKAIESLEAMGVSAEFTTDLTLLFRGRFGDDAAAEKISAFVLRALNDLKEEDNLHRLMILFAGAAEKKEDIIEIIEETAVIVDGPVLTLQQKIPGQSPILHNIRDAFFGAAETPDDPAREPIEMTEPGTGEVDKRNQDQTPSAQEFY